MNGTEKCEPNREVNVRWWGTSGGYESSERKGRKIFKKPNTFLIKQRLGLF